MPSTILTNWTVYYASDSGGHKQIKWTGAGAPETNTNTVNELYSSLMDLFSVSTQNDANDTIPMSAVTPTVYTLGAIDTGDLEPWFIDPESIKHLTGGSIQTEDWSRDITTRTSSRGIVRIPRTGSNIVSGDIGNTITNTTDGDTGTLLYVETSYLWIRPTDGTSANDWNSTGTITITCNSHSDSQTGTSVYGERLWSNIYSLGTVESNTKMLVYQNGSAITSFWGDGHLDRLFLVDDDYDTGLIDYGYLTVFSRQYTKLYDHYLVDASAGGRNPVPLGTTPDVNNTTGYYQFIGTGGSGTFNSGNGIYVGSTWATATAKGILTSVSSYTLTYYLVGDLTNFSTGTVKEYVLATGVDGDATCTAATPSSVGPATTPSSGITVTFGGTNYDLNNGNGSRPYSVAVNCNGATVEQVYERLKYITHRGYTSDIDAGTQTIAGEQYIATGDYYIPYDTGSQDNPFTEGETITATNFSCVLTSKHDQGSSEGFLVVRSVRGTVPTDNTTLTGVTSGHTALVDNDSGNDPTTAITATKVSPFGTFAGGKFYGARGVYLYNMAGADSNDISLIDAEGITQNPPSTVAITVNGVVSGDKVSVFRADDANGTINRTYMTSHNTNNTAGISTFEVNSIPNDTPSTGRLRIRNQAGTIEYHIRYSSWTSATFALRTAVTGIISAIDDVTGRMFYDTNASLSTIQPGDLVNNTTDGSWAQIITVENPSGDDYVFTHTPLSGGSDNEWDVSDNYSFHTLPISFNNTYTAYVPYIDAIATGTSISTSVTYIADRNISTQVRRKGIIPFTTNAVSLTSSGYTATAVRTTDSIAV